MEAKATTKYLRVQPRKVRIVADEVRGKSAVYAAASLRYHSSKSARLLRKTLLSAIANAIETKGMDGDRLRVAVIEVNDGPILKRMQARAMGRGNRISKKTAHITVVIDDALEVPVRKETKSKAKPRPTFGAAKPKKGAAVKAAKPEKAEKIEEVKEEVVEATPAPDVTSEATEEKGE